MQRILSKMQKAIKQYNLIENGDKIAVGVSGGKDSLMLLKCLATYQKFSDEKFELIAISIDQSSGNLNFEKIKNFCKELGVDFYIIKTDIFNVVFNERKEKNPCSLCAKMRRGSLNSAAKEKGCNKVALAHHADDLIETFFLSMFYESRLSTFMPKTYLSNVDITAIRPFILVDEKDIISKENTLPVLDNPCPANKHTQRQFIKELLAKIENDIPNARERILSSLIETQRYNLFNKKF